MCSYSHPNQVDVDFRKALVQLLGISYGIIEVVWDWPRLEISPSPLATMESWITPLLSVVGVLLAIGLTWHRKPAASGVQYRVGAVVILVVLALSDIYFYLSYVHYIESTEALEWTRARYYIQSVLWACWIAFIAAAYAILADIVWRAFRR